MGSDRCVFKSQKLPLSDFQNFAALPLREWRKYFRLFRDFSPSPFCRGSGLRPVRYIIYKSGSQLLLVQFIASRPPPSPPLPHLVRFLGSKSSVDRIKQVKQSSVELCAVFGTKQKQAVRFQKERERE